MKILVRLPGGGLNALIAVVPKNQQNHLWLQNGKSYECSGAIFYPKGAKIEFLME